MHVFYIDIWKEILKYLEQLEINYDLYITVPQGMDDNDIINIFNINTGHRPYEMLFFHHMPAFT